MLNRQSLFKLKEKILGMQNIKNLSKYYFKIYLILYVTDLDTFLLLR